MNRNEAIDTIRNNWPSSKYQLAEALETLIPELKKDDDVMKRMAIKAVLAPEAQSCIKSWGINPKDVIAWLEKQGHDGKKWMYEDDYIKEKEQVFQDGITEVLENPQKYGFEKQSEIDKESYDIAEKEKREFVGDGFIKCYADFQDFKEGETYWLEYLGNDNYNVRSDNLLGKTYHITPCQLYTIFKKQTWLEKQEILESIKHKEAMLDCQTCANYKKECNPDKNIFKCSYPIKYNGGKKPQDVDEKQDELQFWKPSEKQLEALDYAYNSCPDTERGNYYEGVLETLIDDLHKLSEKQREQKPILDFKAKDWYVSKVDGKIHNIYHSVDKVEPKFKVGDWVIYECGEDSATLQIKNIVDRTYEFTDDSTLNVVDEYALRLWTIQDAKKGDILQANKCTLIFDSLIKCIDGNTVISSWYSCDNEKFYGMGTSQPDLWVTEGVVPATKKQCDLLFQKMKEAGLWDADKLELRMTKEESVLKEFVPKFKAGDWVVYKGLTCLVIKNVAEYTLKPCGSDLSQEVVVYYTDEDKLHLWTIEDAKPGDVLHSTGLHNDCIFIFNGLDNWKFDEPNGDRAVATGYCSLFVSADKMEFGTQGPDCIEVNTVKPATKIQHDLFFSKMHEAGYEWNPEKKELKLKPKFEVGDWVVRENNETQQIEKIKDLPGGYHQYWTTDGRWFGDATEARLWTIEDAKDGNVLIAGDWLIIFRPNKYPKPINDPRFYCHYDTKSDTFDTDDEFHSLAIGTKYSPATKEQRDLLFSKMKEAGYEWNEDKKELKKIEQKSANKCEPKFKVSDWIYKDGAMWRIIGISDKEYILAGKPDVVIREPIHIIDSEFRLWSIADAKDGDVLAADECIVLFKEIDGLNIKCHCTYYLMNNPMFLVKTLHNASVFQPANKEQYDLLFQEMKEAGYEWNLEKKELKKIEQNFIPKYKTGDCIEYRGEKYKITKVSVLPHNFIYDVSLVEAPSDSEEVVTSIGMAAEEQMLKIEKSTAWSEEDEKRSNMKLICNNPLYRIKTSKFCFLVKWNKVIDLETKEIYYEANGVINKLLAKIIYKKFRIMEKDLI